MHSMDSSYSYRLELYASGSFKAYRKESERSYEHARTSTKSTPKALISRTSPTRAIAPVLIVLMRRSKVAGESL